MRCPTCGRETENAECCPYCREGGAEVKVLTPDERESFRGVTLDSGPAADEESRGGGYGYESRGPHHRVYVRQVNFGGKTSLLTKLIVLAVIGVVVFVVLPMFFLLFAAAGVVWFILSLLRR
jgi:hypothetical protein